MNTFKTIIVMNKRQKYAIRPSHKATMHQLLGNTNEKLYIDSLPRIYLLTHRAVSVKVYISQTYYIFFPLARFHDSLPNPSVRFRICNFRFCYFIQSQLPFSLNLIVLN